MDRERFDHLLAAYGADFARWPAEDRSAAEAFAAANDDAVSAALAEEQALDTALLSQTVAVDSPELLTARILASQKRQRAGLDWRAVAALAACAVFGVVVGYSGGMLAPPADDEAAYFASAFEAPLYEFDEGEEG